MSASLKERVLIDSNIIVELLSGNEAVKKALIELRKDYQLTMNPIVFSEVAYQTRYIEKKGWYSAYDMKRELKKDDELLEYYTNFVEKGLAQGLRILEVDGETVDITNRLIEEKRPLPNDALILATALKFEIRKVITLNGDFDVGVS